MVKHLTDAELAALAKKGTVKFDPVEQNIARFGELIEKMTEMLASNAQRTQADLARSQVQLEILATLQKNMSKRSQGVIRSQEIDLGPLTELLVQIQSENSRQEKTTYVFDIQRDPGGGMARVIATPQEPTRH